MFEVLQLIEEEELVEVERKARRVAVERRSACAAWIVSRFTPTSRSSPAWVRLLRGRGQTALAAA